MSSEPRARAKILGDRVRLGRLLLILLVAALFGRLLGEGAPMATGSTFQDEPLQVLRRLEAPYVFIGNSMLGTRIDPVELSKQLGGEPVGFLEVGGSSSALWYLQFKNYLVASKTEPKRAVFFFRNRYLTEPLYRTTGKYADYIAAASHPEEPILELVLSGEERDWRFRMHQSIKGAIPLHRYRHTLERGLEGLGTLSAAGCCPNQSDKEILSTVNDVFSVDNLRKIEKNDAVSENATEPMEFNRALGTSFLPHIIRLAKKHEIQLFFVRVQHRPPIKSDASLERYMEQLAKYLAGSGAGFIDLTKGNTAPLKWYGKGDHIAPTYRKKYTEWFRTRARAIFEDSK